MTRNDLFLCMDAVDDDVLARSDKTTRVETHQKRRNGWWIAAAACVCLIVGLGAWGLFNSGKSPIIPDEPLSSSYANENQMGQYNHTEVLQTGNPNYSYWNNTEALLAAMREAQEKSGNIAGVQWEKITLSEAVLSSNTAFVGTLLELSPIPETAQIEAKFKVETDLYGNLPEEILYCYLWDTASGNAYSVGNQYLMITTASNHPFYPHTLYSPVSDGIFDLTKQEYTLCGEELEYANPEQLCNTVRNTFLEEKTPEQVADGITWEGTWETAEYIASVKLVSVVKEPTPLFSGTSFFAEIIEVQKGNSEDIEFYEESTILLVLGPGSAKVGDTILIGFSDKEKVGVYTQEGPNTTTYK